MDILFVTANLPYPPTDGWKMRVFSLVRSLSRRHRVFIASFIRTTEDPVAIEGLRAYCAGVWAIARNPRYSPWKLFLGLVGPWPFTVINYRDKRMAHLVTQLLKERPFDFLQAESLEMAQYCLPLAHRTILDLHNIDSLLVKRYAEWERHPLKRMYAEVMWRKLAKYERAVCTRFVQCLTCSDQDKALLREHSAVSRTSVIPNGVDLEVYTLDGRESEVRNRLLFVGRMDYHANVDGVQWFCKQVLPRVRSYRPDVVFQVVGGFPTKEVQQLAIPGAVEIVGLVEDLRPYIKAAAVVVVPLRVGSGTRLKILEAWAMEKPVVSTSIGIEGIKAIPEKEILVADTSGEFADQVLRALNDAELRREMGQAARRLVEREYSWNCVGSRLEEVYQLCLKTSC